MKFINTLFVDYQPGGPCTGSIFQDQYNEKLAFWLAEYDNEQLEINEKLRDKTRVKISLGTAKLFSEVEETKDDLNVTHLKKAREDLENLT